MAQMMDARAGAAGPTGFARLLKQSDVLMALVWLPSGEEHAVLVARTRQGDYVLDNLRSDVVPWTSTGYRWNKVQSPTNRWSWRTVQT